MFCRTQRPRAKVIFKRAETYAKEYLHKEKEQVRLKRAARTAGDFYVPRRAQGLLRRPYPRYQ